MIRQALVSPFATFLLALLLLPSPSSADAKRFEAFVTATPIGATRILMRAEMKNDARSDKCIRSVESTISFFDGESAGAYFMASGILFEASLESAGYTVMALRKSEDVILELVYTLLPLDIDTFALMHNPEIQAEFLAETQKRIAVGRYSLQPVIYYAPCTLDASVQSGQLVGSDLVKRLAKQREAALQPLVVTGVTGTR